MPDHFDIFDEDEHDIGMGRHCTPCNLWRHADCGPLCRATRHPEPQPQPIHTSE